MWGDGDQENQSHGPKDHYQRQSFTGQRTKIRIHVSYIQDVHGLSYRSEGEAERDIGSTCMIGPGLVVVENSSVAAAVAVTWGWTPQNCGFVLRIWDTVTFVQGVCF